MRAARQASVSRRVSHASSVLLMNVVFWVLIPYALSAYLSSLPGIPLTTGLIYVFGAVITGLQVLGALTEGMAISVPFVSGSYIASAYYIWTATDGGRLTVHLSTLSVELGFSLLVYLLILPSLFSALKAPIAYLLEQSEAGSAAAEDLFVG
jgi:hypothetical protein